MQIQENISLKPYNTFGIDVNARYYSCFKDSTELSELLTAYPRTYRLVLGGGSNILLTRHVDGLVMKNGIKGIRVVKEDEEFVYVQAGAGEPWHSFVLYCIEQQWAGVENLSLIPGSVGAAPMQNIGAYGVELKDVFHELKAFHIEEKTNYTFGLKDCCFGYRESVFKSKYRDQFVILHVTFKLRKKPAYTISYGAIEEQLQKMGVQELSIRAISDAVIAIRSSKLPDPAVTGNAGSFFKNPVVTAAQAAQLKARFENIVLYQQADGSCKLAAGWLIEHCGPAVGTRWKGYREGDAGCHPQQALVLVNYGTATGQQLLSLSDRIAASVVEKFDVQLEKEVNIF